MTEATASAAAAGLAALIQGSAGQTKTAAKGCPEGKRYHQVAEGKATPLWLMGHLANVANFTGVVIGLGQESLLPPTFNKCFTPTEFGGGPVTTNAEDYPSWEEVNEGYEKVMTVLGEGIAALTDEQLAGPCLGKVPPPMAGMLSNIQASIAMNIIHDSHHCGQLALLAKC